MNINQKQKERIAGFVPVFRKYIQSSEFPEDRADRHEREALYANILSQETIEEMTELEFGQVISSLWASQMWGNKGYLVDKLVKENGLPALRSQLKNLLWGTGNFIVRYNEYRKKIKGFGTAMLAEILSFVHPDHFGIWNNRARTALKQLGFEDVLPFINKTQLSGKEYQKFNELLAHIVNELKKLGYSGNPLINS